MHSMNLNAQRRSVSIGSTETLLTEKVWQVLVKLRENPHRVVTRQEIIEAVWTGNFLTGEKGLNQAMWSLRAALNDDKHAPRFIRTIPRVGYQWVYQDAVAATPATNSKRKRAHIALAASLLLVAASAGLGIRALEAPGLTADDKIATRAYLVNRDIHVEFASGCLGIVKNANHANIGPPVVSADGRSLAVTVREPGGCRMVTIDVASGEAQRFPGCPASEI